MKDLSSELPLLGATIKVANNSGERFWQKLTNAVFMFLKARTWITNIGMKSLCLDGDQQAGRGQISIYRRETVLQFSSSKRRLAESKVRNGFLAKIGRFI